jgi:hypothetical protein
MGCLIRLGSVLLTLSLVYPAAVLAQGSISGVVRDTSGAVLPGVTVEAASPVLIEKARTAVTDGAGQYRIVDLRPGTYAVTFTLPGFSIVKREGIELTGQFAATVNAELRVGTVEETITVTGETAIVDVQNTTKQAVMTREILDAIPAGRNHRLYAVLIPGMSGGGGDVGGQNALSLTSISIHGGRSTDQRLKVDGTSIRNTSGEGWSTNFVPDMSSTQEVTVDYASGSAENVTSGVTFNYIPREGSNRFSMSVFATAVNSSFQGDNYSQELADAGLGARNRLHTLVDINPSTGGPILRDRLWFYAAGRWQVNKNYVGGLWYNQNAGDLTRWDYVPGDQAVFRLTQGSGNGRLTWQAAQKHKVNFFFEDQGRDYDWVHLPEAPEANQHWIFPSMWVASTKYSAPLTSRLLLEGGFTLRTEDIWDPHPGPGDPFQDAISVTEQGGIIPGLRYRGIMISASSDTDMWEATGALSYVTGSHALKVGASNFWGSRVSWNPDSLPTSLVYRFLNGVPNQITQSQRNYDNNETGVRADLGIYAQDRWTLKRLTLTPGIRFDYFHSGFNESYFGPLILLPDRNITFPAGSWYRFTDIMPRMGAAYDLFGNGKTALKANLSKYMVGLNARDGETFAARLVPSVTRTWTDANRNYIPDCDLTDNLGQDRRATGGDFCGTVSDLRYGQAIPSNRYDPETLEGWGRRPYNWEFSTGIQQQVAPRVSVDVSYFRRWYGNFTVTDNEAVAATDFGAFTVTAPVDSRMPDGGGYPVGNFYNVNPNKVGQVDNYVTRASVFGKQIDHWNGVDITMNARPGAGILVQGGMSTGRRTTDTCELREKLPEIAPTDAFCHVNGAFVTSVKFLGTYMVPKIGVQLAAAFQNLAGPEILAQTIYTNAQVQGSLGRPLSAGAPNVTVNVVDPNTMYGERLTQLDLRLSKILRFSGTRTAVNLDIYNVFNGNAIRSVNNNYNAWQRPTNILDARLFKISGQFDF